MMSKAMKRLAKEARQGDANAQPLLGISCAVGGDVPQDETEAEKWYRLAAERGNVDARERLGSDHPNGSGKWGSA